MADSTRARNPRGQGERLRLTLLDAARELLLELGDQDKLSVRAVTARAGVTPNALYLHFAGKDDLLSAVINAGYGELRGLRDAAAEGPTRSSNCARSASRTWTLRPNVPGSTGSSS